ncbi:carboxymuconolactone decarboxylase family protein [Salinactinospora qingdaonensis]|uniref:Carboxymuconolactone decarboxylase family protein n=1 Tax=Salinactinospora qingdaonensis TaxID=702744 RepID=A0ABP7FWS8_9ACTN
MAPAPLRAALLRTLDQIRYVDVARPGDAPAPVARIYGQVERDFGMLAPPVALHAPHPDALAASWVLLRETLLTPSRTDRAAREAVATAVSLANTCPYCVDVHGATLEGLVGRGRGLSAGEGAGAAADPRLRGVAAWAEAVATAEGAAGHRRPFSAEQLPELGGVALTFHYLNRMVNVFLGESPLPRRMPGVVRGRARGMLGRFLRPGARRAHRPGASLDLLPEAPLPAELAWAAPEPTVAQALARSCAAVAAAGRQWVPESVRDLVAEHLAGWAGEPPGLSRAWVEEAVARIPAQDRTAGRLALLTAMASYQVDEATVAGYRRDRPEDAALVALTAWASLAAARRLGEWLPTVPSRN